MRNLKTNGAGGKFAKNPRYQSCALNDHLSNMLRHAQKVRAIYTAVPEPGLVAGVPGPRWIARLVQGDTLSSSQGHDVKALSMR